MQTILLSLEHVQVAFGSGDKQSERNKGVLAREGGREGGRQGGSAATCMYSMVA